MTFTSARTQAGQFDACCLSGDLLDMFPGSRTGLRQQACWVRSWLKEFPGQLYACTGNHDWWPRDERLVDTDAEGGWLRQAARPGVGVDGTSAHHGDRRFVCCPWAQARQIDDPGPVVLLVHAPPQGTQVAAGLGCDLGDPEVTPVVARLAAGSMVLSGHLHDPRRWFAPIGHAWCFNPGVDFAATVPNHILINTASGEATFRGWGREVGPVRIAGPY